MNNFEKFLLEHKKDYDLPDVNPAVWERIKVGGSPKKRMTVRRMINRRTGAAAAILLLISVFLFWPPAHSTKLSADLLREFGFESHQPHLVARAVANELATTPVSPQYQQEFLNMMAALQALDLRYASVLKELEKKNPAEFTERQALTYYRRKVDLMTKLIKDLSTLNNYDKSYPQNNTDLAPGI